MKCYNFTKNKGYSIIFYLIFEIKYSRYLDDRNSVITN